MKTMHFAPFDPIGPNSNYRKEQTSDNSRPEVARGQTTAVPRAHKSAEAPNTVEDDYVYTGEPTEQTVHTAVQLAPPRNALNALQNVRIQADVIRELSRKLLESKDRHGEALALCSACEQLIGNARVIVAYEQEAECR